MRTIALAAALLAIPSAASAEPLKVVASFSILADMVQEVGGEHVIVTSLVGPGEDAHVYEPVPADVVAVADADLVVVNGLGFEGFLDRLVEASGTQAPIIIASHDVQAIALEDDHGDHDDHGHAEEGHDDHGHADEGHDDHAHADEGHDDHGHADEGHDDHAHADEDHDEHAGHDHGPLDPHAWQSLEAARFYIEEITEGLCAVAADHCDAFTQNAADYSQQIIELGDETQNAMGLVPQDERIIITSHDAFAYLARDLGLTVLAAQGLSTESEASAADVALLIDQIRDTGARALFVETVSDPRLITQIADETGLTVSGTLYSDALSGSDGPAATYLEMMRYNADAIVAALSGS